MAVNVKIGLIGALDMLKFKNMAKVRENAIQAAPAKEITADYAINNNAKALHPDYVKLVVSEVIDHPGAASKTIVFKAADGGKLPYFRAGQYLSLKMKIGDSVISRPYSISSAPKEALEGKYELTVRTNPGGFAAEYLLSDVKEGDSFTASSPQGNFYYEELRDPAHIVALAGGSGITPFLSMAKAIADGTEDFKLTILFGSRTEEQILFKDELEKLAENEKIEVVHVLSDEEKDGYENGFITAELIRKYAGDDYSVFICGPEAMYRFLEGELAKLGLERKNIRREALGVTKKVASLPDFPEAAKGKTFTLKIRQGAAECEIPASAEEPILVAVERAGITAPSRCRSGECGWCRSKVISGEYYAPVENESRRWADKELGYIHPCATFPVSDMEIEVPGEYV
ncbi:MAG: 2Fe-2S iron-sulfur cluster binding domain-containing protein [Lachnospiraceae bacterium]|nr:2Fe-2S iron-sulfur cluster binding domain-containing protein [Lachnospiraceae bacterium]